jgi:hypothetical protein
MKRLMIGATAALLATLAFATIVSANPGKPDFSGGIYADGQLFGTKGAATIPAPNSHNVQSFDVLVRFDNQPAVSEAGPGNPDFNGGRWILKTATWNTDPYLLTSYADVLAAEQAGDITIVNDHSYLECPLLPTMS